MPDDVLNGILDSASDDQSANSTGRTPLVIDSDLRTIKVPTDYVFGVQNDQDVLTVPFVVPRYCDGVDLSELSIRINFTTKSGLSSYYDVTDKTVNTDTIEFTWLLGAAVFVSVGDLTFAVCIRKVEADGRITKEFNTTLATAKILPGLTVEDQKDPTQYSILVQMQNIAESVNATIEDAEDYAEQLRNYVGAPLVATAASDMTDQNRIYVYVGNENGYNNGHWYYYQSLTWHDGGTYNSPTAGDYPDIYAGNVMSDRYQTDQTPYLLRKTAETLDGIGERCYPVLVGASVVENQLIKSIDEESIGSIGCSISKTDDVVTVVPTSVYSRITISKTLIKGHKYFAYCQINASEGDGAIWFWGGTPFVRVSMNDTWKDVYVLYNHPSNTQGYRIDYGVASNNNLVTYQIRNCMLIDFSLLFPSSIADYVYTLEQATAGAGISKLREWGFLRGYQAYNAGSLESVEVTGKKVVGFNQWDEVLETGLYNSSGKAWGDSYWRCTNPVKVIPNKSYYLQYPSNVTLYMYGYSDANFSNGRSMSSTNHIVTIPNDTHYFAFAMPKSQYGTTYNNDICINLSSDRNGEYEPYTSTTYELGSDVLRGIFKLDANNNLYADGDRKEADGTITRKYGVVDLGTLNWTFNTNSSWNCFISNVDKKNGINNILCGTYSNGTVYGTTTDKIISGNTSGKNIYIRDSSFNGDAAAFKTAMSGVMLVYEAATPTTEQSTPFVSAQTVYPDGTEEFVTENEVPVGHVTKYPYDLKTQAERLIDIPDVPSTNGTYVLKATRSSSGINYTWVTG